MDEYSSTVRQLFTSPTPQRPPRAVEPPSISPSKTELVRLRQENARLREYLTSKQAPTVTLSPELWSVKNTSVERIRFLKPCTTDSSRALAELIHDDGITSSMSSLAQNIVSLFSTRVDHGHYTRSTKFAREIMQLSRKAAELFSAEDRLLSLSSPMYVLGDIHGNMADLRFFSENIWTLGVPLTPGTFLFLGDYVDRGQESLEVVAYLFALKILCPRKVFMLRGNHELRRVNGWEAWYKEGSFIAQCKKRFGVELGSAVWEEVNAAFDCLPFAAVVDDRVFCAHGGIPRPFECDIPQSLLATYSNGSLSSSTTHGGCRDDIATPHVVMDVNPPSAPMSIGIAGKSPRPKRVVATPTSSTISSPSGGVPLSTPKTTPHYNQPDLRLLALANVPVPLKLMTIPPRPAIATPQQTASTSFNLHEGTPLGTPHSHASSVSLSDSHIHSPFSCGDCNSKTTYEPLAKCIDENAVTRVAMDVLWADPASRELELSGALDKSGFGPGIRGGDTFCFGEAAVQAFLSAYNFDIIIRAHQATAAGIEVTESSKVCTVFSTSKDHGCGPQATCGCLMIENGVIHPIQRSVCYDMSVTPSAHHCTRPTNSTPTKRHTASPTPGTPRPTLSVSLADLDTPTITQPSSNTRSPTRRSDTGHTGTSTSPSSRLPATLANTRTTSSSSSMLKSPSTTTRTILSSLNTNTPVDVPKRSATMRASLTAGYAAKYAGSGTKGEYHVTEEKSED